MTQSKVDNHDWDVHGCEDFLAVLLWMEQLQGGSVTVQGLFLPVTTPFFLTGSAYTYFRTAHVKVLLHLVFTEKVVLSSITIPSSLNESCCAII